MPIRLYIPQSPGGNAAAAEGNNNGAGSFKVVQSLVSPLANERQYHLPPMDIACPFLLPTSNHVLTDLE